MSNVPSGRSAFWFVESPARTNNIPNALWRFAKLSSARDFMQSRSFSREHLIGFCVLDDIKISYSGVHIYAEEEYSMSIQVGATRQRAEHTIDNQSWPQNFTLSRLLSPQALSEPIYILRGPGPAALFYWWGRSLGDPVGGFTFEYEAAQDALSALEC